MDRNGLTPMMQRITLITLSLLTSFLCLFLFTQDEFHSFFQRSLQPEQKIAAGKYRQALGKSKTSVSEIRSGPEFLPVQNIMPLLPRPVLAPGPEAQPRPDVPAGRRYMRRSRSTFS